MDDAGISPSEGANYLVVDDHEGFRRFLRGYLPGQQFKVVECSNGREAVEGYERCRPDWVIMDVEMPVMDGMAATRFIRSRHPEARIIILTQHDLPEMREEARAVGAVAFVAKDNLGELPEVILSLSQDSPTNPNPGSSL